MVSVVIPTYNRADVVGRAVESALAQSYRELEVIVVDDGSNDGTCDVLKEFGDRIRVIPQKNSGPSAARNRGVHEARGEVISFLDSDDVWLPGKIEAQMKILEHGGEDVCCCLCNCELEDSAGRAVTSFGISGLGNAPDAGFLLNPDEILSSRFLLFNQAVAIRKAAFLKVGGFHEDLWLLEDHHLALKLSMLGKWGVVGPPQVLKYEEEDSLGGAARKDHAKHLAAVDQVLSLVLDQHQPRPAPKLRKALENERGRIRSAANANRLKASPSQVSSSLGRALLLHQRITNAMRRRSFLWPRPVFENAAPPKPSTL